jgi:hypothetical protein
MSTRSSIWLGESEGKSVHIYWELADRKQKTAESPEHPIYIAVDADEEVAIRLPKEIAIRLLTILSPTWVDRTPGSPNNEACNNYSVISARVRLFNHTAP